MAESDPIRQQRSVNVSAGVRCYTVKTFKSGNSLAVRLPASLELGIGVELELRQTVDGGLLLERANRPKRKFNIEKVWGSATGLDLIGDEDRVFEERQLFYPEPSDIDDDRSQ